MQANSVMEINGLNAVLHTPPALSGEHVHALPPPSPKPAFSVDEWPACPANWMHGSATAKSYFVGVQEGRGMWLDFTANKHHTHDVAILVSVQGINPITGQSTLFEEGESKLRLEQYRTKCPVHDKEFTGDRFCADCKFSWPGQNYLPSTSSLPLWIDGFKTKEGVVRQYIITADDKKGVAAQVLGDKRVFAIAIAFYLSKERKPAQIDSFLRSGSLGFAASGGGMKSYLSPPGQNDVFYMSAEPKGIRHRGMLKSSPDAYINNTSSSPPSSMCFSPEKEEKTSGGIDLDVGGVNHEAFKTLEIGAGAQIDQKIGYDPKDLAYWQDQPVGLIYINYCSDEQAMAIIQAGRREEKTEGPLAGLVVGN